MVSSPHSNTGVFQRMSSKTQERRNEKIAKHLATIGIDENKVDPSLTKRDDSEKHLTQRYFRHAVPFPFVGPMVFAKTELKRAKKLEEINESVRTKRRNSPQPYAVVKTRFANETEAENFVDEKLKAWAPGMRQWENALNSPVVDQTALFNRGDLFEIPFHTKPKVVLILKTSNP